ncbi:MAG TPA: glycerol-3-phosphate 1-O-acyltransferase PlsY [Opitutaceae bacterium]
MLLPLLIAGVVGYFLGAIPFGYVVARAHGVNIFQEGSKNPGATNVKRVLGERFGARGKRAGNLVFALDVLKGALAAGWGLLAFTRMTVSYRFYNSEAPGGGVAGEDWLLVGVAGLIGALLGHSFSCFTKFKGGKGVATGAGGFLVLAPVATLIGGAVWIVTFYTSRYVSLASILAAVALPIAAFFLGLPTAVTVIAAIVAVFVVIRHRANISRLLAGTESKFVKKPKPAKS